MMKLATALTLGAAAAFAPTARVTTSVVVNVKHPASRLASRDELRHGDMELKMANLDFEGYV